MKRSEHCQYLDGFLNDQLPASQHSRFAQHLAECQSCQNAIEHQQSVDQLLSQALTSVTAPAPVRSRLLQTLASDSKATLEGERPLNAGNHRIKPASLKSYQNARIVYLSASVATLLVLALLFGWSVLSPNETPLSNQTQGPGRLQERVKPNTENTGASDLREEIPPVIFLATSSKVTLLQPLPQTEQNFTVVKAYQIRPTRPKPLHQPPLHVPD